MLVKFGPRRNNNSVLWVKADRFSKQLELDRMRIEKRIKKYEARIKVMPPPIHFDPLIGLSHEPHVSFITITDGPDGFHQSSSDLLPE